MNHAGCPLPLRICLSVMMLALAFVFLCAGQRHAQAQEAAILPNTAPPQRLSQDIFPDKPLAIDLSQHKIGISSGFSGTSVVLFGIQKQAGDLAIVVRGPARTTILREKGSVLGFWLTTESVRFPNIPGFYAVASTRDIAMLGAPDVLAAHQIGLDYLTLESDKKGWSADETRRYEDALIQTKQMQELFILRTKNVEYITDELFKISLWFPSNIPVGDYKVDAYLFRDGALIGGDSRTLAIAQIGFNADLRRFAHNEPWFYAFLTIVTALFSGWLATVLLRRD